jgi:hypothetical protein
MRTSKLLKSTLAMGCIVMASNAAAQCPATFTNPLEALVGPWSFSTLGFSRSPTPWAPSGPLGTGGQFVAAVGKDKTGNLIGILTITQTANNNGQVFRLEKDSGTFQVFPDCSGGTLVFNLSSRPMTFDFTFATSAQRMINLVSTTSEVTVTGTATAVLTKCHGLCNDCDDICVPDGPCARAYNRCINSCTDTGKPTPCLAFPSSSR